MRTTIALVLALLLPACVVEADDGDAPTGSTGAATGSSLPGQFTCSEIVQCLTREDAGEPGCALDRQLELEAAEDARDLCEGLLETNPGNYAGCIARECGDD